MRWALNSLLDLNSPRLRLASCFCAYLPHLPQHGTEKNQTAWPQAWAVRDPSIVVPPWKKVISTSVRLLSATDILFFILAWQCDLLSWHVECAGHF
jgi:hypothetical protein